MPRGEITTEADALRDILVWSSSRPLWQKDALRRLVAQGQLTDQDIDELTALCKDASLPSRPISTDDIGSQQSGGPTVSLKTIRDVQNVNALAEKQSLNFLPKGITIVYGDNGAGKSGYVRILKRACRARTARGRDEPILPNIYERSAGPQSARLEYLAGGQSQTTTWNSDQPCDVMLSEISVFDSRTANVHVEDTNDLAYTPYPMKLLERLVNACGAVKARLDSEISGIKGQTPQSVSNPACSESTAVGKLMRSLRKDTKAEAVEALAKLSDDDRTRQTELASDLAHDPILTARRLQAQKARLESLRSSFERLHDAVSDDNADKLNALSADLQAKRDAARLAAQQFSGEEPLDGVGSESWRRLWEAARAYSTAEAYPDQSFPNTSETALCVLCHQELGDTATQRLSRFEAFVQDQTQQDEIVAKRAFDAFVDRLRAATIPTSELIKEKRFLEDELGSTDLASSVRRFAILARWRLRAILRREQVTEKNIPDLSETGLDSAIHALNERATVLLADEKSDERAKLRSELEELQDRQWLAGVKDDVLAEIQRRKSIAELESARVATATTDITSKNTSLSGVLVTERLRARFAKEIDRLNLAGLAVELTQARSQYGVSRFKVSLVQDKTQNAGEILSEGEYRCVALAGFLGELATNDSNSGIIFDDPVSSLDHLHREAIARRLAEEGQQRQVIVFTHDLPFLFLLRNACTQLGNAADKTDVALRHVQKRSNTPGYCRNEAPDKAQNAQARLKTIRTHLANARAQYDRDPDGTDWLITARGLIDSLRQTWEAAVEHAISPVLRTFSSKVNTKGFAKLSAITQEDAETMRKHYGQCSELLHKISDEMNPSAPDPESIGLEIDALESWLEAISARQASIRSR